MRGPGGARSGHRAGLLLRAAGRPELRWRGCPGRAAPRRRDRSPGRRGHGLGCGASAGVAPEKSGVEAPASAGWGGGAGRESPQRPLVGFPPARGPGRRERRACAALQPGLRRAPGRAGGASGPRAGGGAAAAGGPGGGEGERAAQVNRRRHRGPRSAQPRLPGR